MNFALLSLMTLSCLLSGTLTSSCVNGEQSANEPAVAAAVSHKPTKTGDSVDVVLSADAALVWDLDSDEILYEKNKDEERPIASINKLLSVLVVRDELPLSKIVEIPSEVKKAQRLGADVELPIGEHATVKDLLAASLIPSANDAMTTLAVAVSGSESTFAEKTTNFAATHGLTHTVAANSTGLSGGTQHSAAIDVKELMTRAFNDSVLREMMNQPTGTLTTIEGSRREYKSTNDLLKTYVPILAAKTGYTVEAGENLVIVTAGANGQRIGAVVLGSKDRFQDMKILVEWIWRNWTWK